MLNNYRGSIVFDKPSIIQYNFNRRTRSYILTNHEFDVSTHGDSCHLLDNALLKCANKRCIKISKPNISIKS